MTYGYLPSPLQKHFVLSFPRPQNPQNVAMIPDKIHSGLCDSVRHAFDARQTTESFPSWKIGPENLESFVSLAIPRRHTSRRCQLPIGGYN